MIPALTLGATTGLFIAAGQAALAHDMVSAWAAFVPGCVLGVGLLRRLGR